MRQTRPWLTAALFLLVSGLLLSASSASALSTVEGKILDDRDRPVRGARVFSWPSTGVACTDARGQYQITNIPDWGEAMTLLIHLPNGDVYQESFIPQGAGTDRRLSLSASNNKPALTAVPFVRCRSSRKNLPSRPRRVVGRVIDEDGAPMVNAVVSVVGQRRAARTNKYGYYDLSMRGLRGSRFELRARKAGYKTESAATIVPLGEMRVNDWLFSKLSRRKSKKGTIKRPKAKPRVKTEPIKRPVRKAPRRRPVR